jgi:hypothetical protein
MAAWVGEAIETPLIEECAWRAARSRRWLPQAQPAWRHYRDGKEWPGAVGRADGGVVSGASQGPRGRQGRARCADFYCGEMEMRCHAGGRGEVYRGQVERAILTLYVAAGIALGGLQTWLASSSMRSNWPAFAAATKDGTRSWSPSRQLLHRGLPNDLTPMAW